MPNNKNLPESAEILRVALPLMSKYKIPVTPRNYAVWYEYACGINPPLNEKIDSQIQSGGPITGEYIASLYGEHMNANHEHSQLESAQKLFAVLYQNLITVLKSAAGQTSEYGKTLELYNIRMKNDLDLDELQALIQDMAVSTNAMLNNNSGILKDLDDKRSEVLALQEQLYMARSQAKTDPLTQLPNRKAFFDDVGERHTNGTLKSGDHCLLMLDIDDFKKINDGYGHLFGDKVIKTVAGVLQANIKGKDLAARFGGEEFIAFLPDTNREGAIVVAEAIRKTIANASIVNPRNNQVISKVTVSIGVTKWVSDDRMESAIARADDALYHAKKAGKNRTSFFSAEQPLAV